MKPAQPMRYRLTPWHASKNAIRRGFQSIYAPEASPMLDNHCDTQQQLQR